MHWLTKIFVVIAALLAFVMSGLVVAYTHNADRLVSEYKAQKLRADLAEQEVSRQTAAGAAEREQLQLEIARLNERLAAQESRVASIQRESTNLQASLNQANREKGAFEGELTQFNRVMMTYAKISENQSTELGSLRDQELDHARREIDLTDRINDLSGQLEVAQETQRTLMEQNQDLREQLARIQSGGADALALNTAPALRAPRNFRARVTNVDRTGDGATLVEIGAGSSDQLKKGMELNLVRGGSFLGKVVLVTVTQNQAVGRVDYLGQTPKRPQPGDVVQGSSL